MAVTPTEAKEATVPPTVVAVSAVSVLSIACRI